MIKKAAAAGAVWLALAVSSAFADTTIGNGSTYTINTTNTTINGEVVTWNDTGTLTMTNGATLVVTPTQKRTNYLNDAILLAGGAGTVTMKFNNNDADFLWTNQISSVATAAQTLALYAGLGGAPGGDRLSVTFGSGIPDGNGLALTVYFNTQSGNNSWVNLKGVNTFTGPINLAKAGNVLNGYLTIGGTLTRYMGNTIGSGSLNNGNYPGAIALDTATILNYASTAAQTLAGPISGGGAVQVTGSGVVTLAGTNTYTGNTTVNSGCSLVLATNGGLKFLVTDTTNNVVTGAGTATFNGTFTLDTSAVTVTSNSWTLVNVTTKTFGSNFGLVGFTGPVGNLYSATIGSRAYTFNKSNGVLQVSSPAQISTFGIPTYPGVINQSSKTIAMTIPSTIPLATLAPTFTLSSGTCNQTSGAPPAPNFAVQNPATYTVVDGSVTNTYAVTVTVLDLTSRLYSAPFYVLTTTNGANLPAAASETNFPILLRLNASHFNFSQAQTNGADILFTTATSNALPFEIEQWDAANGTASIWVQVPSIQGNTNRQLLMFWGNTNAASQSSGPAVFNAANGYACVLHMNGVTDSTGALSPANVGTTATNGITGPARSFVVGQGINCGTSITTLPTSGSPSTTELWFRGDTTGGLVGWGIQGSSSKVVLNLASPPHIYLDSNFSVAGNNFNGASTLALSQWYHTAFTYTNGDAKIYVNGAVDAATTSAAMNIANPASLYVGGWNGSYNFAGIIDELRISSLVRSSNWLWLEYQNQNPLQTLVGHLVQPGNAFSVSVTNVTLNEGATTNLTAQAGGAAKVYWLLKQNNQSTVFAVDQFNCPLAAGRVAGNQSYVIQFKAVYPNGSVQTNDIAVTVLDTLPDPVFTLVASTNLWDGRQTMTVTPVISNLAALQAAGATNFTYTWNVAGVAVIKTNPAPGTLTLLRAQGSGPMTVKLTLNNGGALVANSVAVTVQEPASDAWAVRTPATNEVPANNQFYARDDTGFGTIYCNGSVTGSPNSVFLEVYTNGPGGDVLYTNISAAPAGTNFALTARIPAGLLVYSVKWGTVTSGTTNVLGTAGNIVCGDAYVLEGQSNTVTSQVADDFSTNKWIRSYAASGGWGSGVPHGGNWSLGYWGWALATNIVTDHSIPVCIINGAVGGTRIDQHQANPTNHYAPYGPFGYTIYADLLTRVAGAKLTHGIRGVLWHQGEQDQGPLGPDGDFDYKFYQQYFVDMSAAWKQDFPNLRYYYIFQIWPNACGDVTANDMLREVQRTLPRLYSKMRIMSTLGIVPGSSCHYSINGYYQFFNLIGPFVKQDNYGYAPSTDITAPDLQQAYFTTTNRNEIALVFGQNMAWTNAASNLFYFDYISPAAPGANGKVASGSVSNNVIKLQLTAPSTNQTITYVAGSSWDGVQSKLVYGSNNIAALTFAAVTIAAPPVANPPVINSLSPTTGRTNGGTVVTLTGSNFLAGASVQFGGVSATAVSVDSSTQITATTPARSAGAVNVSVANTNGLAATNLNAFTYLLPPPPAQLGSALLTPTNLMLVWRGGTNQSCVLLSTTNVAQPRAAWTPVATNLVGPGGFSTNTLSFGGDSQRFYQLAIPYN